MRFTIVLATWTIRSTKLTVWSFSIRVFVCHFTFNRERSVRSFPLPITKKPHAYEQNTLQLPNTLREAI